VEAEDDALEELLGRLPRGRPEPIVVLRDATDEAVRRDDRAVGPGVAVRPVDALGDVELAALVDGLLAAADLVEEGALLVRRR
jgi:hypothetical protein